MIDAWPAFSFEAVFWETWGPNRDTFLPILVMGFLVSTACGWVGCFLMQRRLAMMGDALSHSLLPGLVLVFMWTGTRHPAVSVTGALAAGLLAVFLIGFLSRRTRLKEDAAMGVVFSVFFAFGIFLVSNRIGDVHLDVECVLYGELGYIGLQPVATWFGLAWFPSEVWRMLMVTLLIGAGLLLFYRPLLVTSFDPELARTLGISPGWYHYGLMVALCLAVVSSFFAVGAILVVAMLIFPGATMRLLTNRLPWMLAGTVPVSLAGALGGLHLAVWLDTAIAPAMVTFAMGIFIVVWGVGGVVRKKGRGIMSKEGGSATEPQMDANNGG